LPKKMDVASCPQPTNYGAAHRAHDGDRGLASEACFHHYVAGQNRVNGLRGSMHPSIGLLKLKLAEKMILFEYKVLCSQLGTPVCGHGQQLHRVLELH
jgi:hypothetical protein